MVFGAGWYKHFVYSVLSYVLDARESSHTANINIFSWPSLSGQRELGPLCGAIYKDTEKKILQKYFLRINCNPQSKHFVVLVISSAQRNREREGGRERDRQTDRETERHTERQRAGGGGEKRNRPIIDF